MLIMGTVPTIKLFILKLVHTVPPGPPTPWIVDTGKDFVIVAWKPPLYNGGGDILGYHVEKVEEINPAANVSDGLDLSE